jgi:catechol 2,3-dioxygenase-like lactoylglutathione lyase family enzyme
MMTTTQVSGAAATDTSNSTTVAMRFEVTTIPVTDVDRAKAFYERLGWRLDADFTFDDHTRGVQFTPPGSAASIQFGQGMEPLQRLYLIVDNIDTVHDDLVRRGVDVSDVWHAAPGQSPEPGRDPDARSYVSYASFSDPDGNTWLLQEITERLPGRV